MSVAAFTPGPWEVGEALNVVNELGALGRDIFSAAPTVEEGDTGICLVAIGANAFIDPRREANANLIAAAPDGYVFAEKVTSALGMAEWSSPEHAEEILQGLIREYHGAGKRFLAKASGLDRGSFHTVDQVADVLGEGL